ncbi:MAG: hypothetical protein WA151_12885 [Desulfatirhabdiaceae bacterium]
MCQKTLMESNKLLNCALGIGGEMIAKVDIAIRLPGSPYVPVKQLRRENAVAKGDERIRGDGDFVEAVLAHATETSP